MSSTSPVVTVVATQPATRNRIVAALVTLALALAVLVSPQLTTAATAHPVKHNAASARAYAKTMLMVLNRERSRHGLRPLTMNAKLIRSAHRHNLHMARADEMSHQLPGEKFFADRISAAHYNWMSAGENIGWNSEMNRPGLWYLQRAMIHEKAPNNGHRLNILDRSFRNVGIDVYFDKSHHKMWFTQDFGQPA